MAKVVFALTDSQVKLLGHLRTGSSVSGFDPRTFSALQKARLAVPDKEGYAGRWGSWRLTPAGNAAVTLCERLAILDPLPGRK